MRTINIIVLLLLINAYSLCGMDKNLDQTTTATTDQLTKSTSDKTKKNRRKYYFTAGVVTSLAVIGVSYWLYEQSRQKTTPDNTTNPESNTTINPIDQVSTTIGSFSRYTGINGQAIHGNQAQSFLTKQMIAQLNPTDSWQTDALTLFEPSLDEQATQNPNNSITITTKYAERTVDLSPRIFELALPILGAGTISLSLSLLKKLADSAHIIASKTFLPAEFYTKIIQTLGTSIQEQERRSVKDLLAPELYAEWQREFVPTYFPTEAAFFQATNLSLILLATSACHTQDVIFFVENLQNNSQAHNKIRNGDLNLTTPVTILSTPGINFAYGNVDQSELTRGGNSSLARILMLNMWRAILSGAKNKGIRILAIPAIGLGAFAGANPIQIASLYFETITTVINERGFQGCFDRIYYNPAQYKAQLDAVIKKQASTCLKNFSGDVKFLAIELAKAGHKCALVNPSDPDVIWGVYDVGEYYKNGHYVGEEDIGATSTAMLGSKGVNPAGYQRVHEAEQPPIS